MNRRILRTWFLTLAVVTMIVGWAGEPDIASLRGLTIATGLAYAMSLYVREDSPNAQDA